MKKSIRTVLLVVFCAVLAASFVGCARLRPDGDPVIKENVFDEGKLADFLTYMDGTNSTGFALWRDGEIQLEKYWNGSGEHDANNIASAGKSFCSILVGIAADRGILALDDKIADYIGHRFSDMSAQEEDEITIRHLLSMTSGLNDLLKKSYQTGEGWAYSDCWNLLFNVLEAATGQSAEDFGKEALFDKIGLEDTSYRSSKFSLRVLRKGRPDYKDWAPKQIYCSARDMIKFGRLLLNRGMWEGERVVSEEYIALATESSNPYNPSYGYLFWLNGKSGAMSPKGDYAEGALIPNAPADTYCALGMGDKKIYIVPSQNLVIARHGRSDSLLSVSSAAFDNELWGELRILFELET